MSTKKRLFLLDAYALIFRGYYAFIKNPRINSKGLDTSAIMGFMNSLMDVIKREKPDHLAVAFDKGGSDLRNDIYPEYKAHRDATPEAIKIAVPYIQELLRAMHIPIIEVKGYEADDLIGTIAKQAEKENFQVFMVTPDKDFAQLVSENIFMYKPARMGNGIEIWGIPEVLAKFEIDRPEQVIDFLGMMGDAADNIPGLPGVGEVTAKKLLKEFGSMENLLANTDKLKGKMKDNIEANKEKGLLSKTLATILLDCPVQFNETDYELSTPDVDKTDALFNELEFRRMAEQFDAIFRKGEAAPAVDEAKLYKKPQPKSEDQFDLFGSAIDEGSEETRHQYYSSLENTEHSYQIIQGDLGIKLLLQNLQNQKSVCFDTETTGLDALHAELVGISFSYEKGKGFYVPFPENQTEAQALIEKFIPFFENENIEKIGQNLKYDLKVLSNYSITVKGKLFDTMIAHYLINPDMRHNMDILSETYLKYAPQSIEALIGKKGKNQGNMADLGPEQIKDYACEDADITYQLKKLLEPEIEKPHLHHLFYDVEMPLAKVLKEIEQEGIAIDTAALTAFSKELDQRLIELDQQIKELAGEAFNIDSPKQLGEILFEKLQISSKAKKTKTGQYATSEDILQKHEHDHPIIGHILEYRQLRKLKSTYVDPLPMLCDPIDGRIHSNFMQTVTATGRLSSNNPNLQNIPVRSAKGREIRRAFVPRSSDFQLMAVDYSQIELRIIAALSGDPNMIAAFKSGHDIHAATAAKVFHTPIDEVSREQRSAAKAVNFGIIYGQSAFGLAQNLQISRTEAKGIIDAYFEQYGTIKTYMDKVIAQARELGYVETILKRRRYLPDIHSANAVVRGFAERNAINAPIQGSAADIIKVAMVAVQNAMSKEKLQSKMILQVHDELVFDVHRDEIEQMQVLVKKAMEQAVSMEVPMEVEMKTADNWLEAH